MRTSTALVIAGLLLAATAGCGSDEPEKVPYDQPCSLLTDAEVTAAAGTEEKGSPQTEGVREGWECRWRRDAGGRDSWELRLLTQNSDGSCYIPQGAVPAPGVDATAHESPDVDAEITAERPGVCLRLYADDSTPEGNGTGISVAEARDLTKKALARLG
jgi:hypothetical protein